MLWLYFCCVCVCVVACCSWVVGGHCVGPASRYTHTISVAFAQVSCLLLSHVRVCMLMGVMCWPCTHTHTHAHTHTHTHALTFLSLCLSAPHSRAFTGVRNVLLRRIVRPLAVGVQQRLRHCAVEHTRAGECMYVTVSTCGCMTTSLCV